MPAAVVGRTLADAGVLAEAEAPPPPPLSGGHGAVVQLAQQQPNADECASDDVDDPGGGGEGVPPSESVAAEHPDDAADDDDDAADDYAADEHWSTAAAVVSLTHPKPMGSSRPDLVTATKDQDGVLLTFVTNASWPIGMSWKHRKIDSAAVANKIHPGEPL